MLTDITCSLLTFLSLFFILFLFLFRLFSSLPPHIFSFLPSSHSFLHNFVLFFADTELLEVIDTSDQNPHPLIYYTELTVYIKSDLLLTTHWVGKYSVSFLSLQQKVQGYHLKRAKICMAPSSETEVIGYYACFWVYDSSNYRAGSTVGRRPLCFIVSRKPRRRWKDQNLRIPFGGMSSVTAQEFNLRGNCIGPSCRCNNLDQNMASLRFTLVLHIDKHIENGKHSK